jgi:RNA polymerase sigma-70 factor (ECF subfamily)
MGLNLNSVRDARFRGAVLPHLDFGFNLALSLLQNRADAEDVLQEASVKAFQSIGQLRSDDAKSWFLAIVRNECMTALRRRAHTHGREISFDDDLPVSVEADSDPSHQAMQAVTRDVLKVAIEKLPVSLREVLILREVQSLSYQQIAIVIGAPIGTVMSRLSRARTTLALNVREGDLP